MHYTLIYLVFLCNLLIGTSDLVVNIRNQGGDIYREEILSDINEETISLSFQIPGDGTTVLLFIDFKNDIQIIQTDVLGEEELNDPPFLSYCFVTKFIKGDFIPPDAMAKLRQKNPWSIRIPERQLSSQSQLDPDLMVYPNSTLDSLLDITSSDWISPHIKTICKDSVTYTTKLDLMPNFYQSGNNTENFLRAVRPIIGASVDCSGVTKASSVPCVCSHPVCIGWYPCALKYCRSKMAGPQGESSGTVKTYRCGIHTCKSCRNYLFSVSNRFGCL